MSKLGNYLNESEEGALNFDCVIDSTRIVLKNHLFSSEVFINKLVDLTQHSNYHKNCVEEIYIYQQQLETIYSDNWTVF